jgi:hypothetical protein
MQRSHVVQPKAAWLQLGWVIKKNMRPTALAQQFCGTFQNNIAAETISLDHKDSVFRLP